MKKPLLKIVLAALAIVALVAIALPSLLHKAGLHPEYDGPINELPGKRALIITTSHAVLNAPGETTGEATGVFGSEFTHPYYTFTDGGMKVDLASIKGGKIPIDPQSFYRPIISPEDKRFLEDPVLLAKVEHSIPLAEVDHGAPCAQEKLLAIRVRGQNRTIAGQGKANPIACILSFAMALRYSFDAGEEADRLEAAIESVLASGARTADLIGEDGQEPISTTEMADAVLEALDASL